MKIRKSFVIGIVITLLLLLGAFVAYYLSQQQQDVRQHAATPPSSNAFGKAALFSAENPPTEAVTTANISTNDKSFTLEFWVDPTNVHQENGNPSFPIISTVSPQDLTSCISELHIGGSRIGDTDTYAISAIINPFSIEGASLTSQSHPLPYNQWANVAFIVNNATHEAKLFVNGVLTDTASLPSTFCSDLDYRIGYDVADGGNVATLVGNLDELRLSDTIRYTDTYTPSTAPFTPDANTLGLWHFDGTLNNEFDNQPLNDPSGAITFVDSTITTAGVPACQATVATCSWNAATDAVSYHYKITRDFPPDGPTPAPDEYLVKEGDVQAPTTSVSFVSEANVSFTCEVNAVNACGSGDAARGSASCIVPTPSAPTPTVPTPTVPTPTVPTPTVPTPTVPTPTVPTPTVTKVPPTPTATVVPPTATLIPTATNTPVPGVPTNTPTPTLPSPGSGIETITIASGIVFTILGALILFVL